MDLSNFDLIPAVIDNANDPEKLGRVKCTIPGVTDNSMICDENMPWVHPLTMSSYQQFSNPMQGQKVWVLVDKEDNKNLWYIPLFEYIDITEDFVKEKYNNNAEVVFARNLGGQKAMMTYDDKDGIILELRDAKIHVQQDGDIELKSHDSYVKIEGGVVYCGKGEDLGGYAQAVKGEQLKSVLTQLQTGIFALQTACGNFPWTSHLVPAVQKMHSSLNNLDPKILCDNTKVN